jgi:hypothetical protein
MEVRKYGRRKIPAEFYTDRIPWKPYLETSLG